MRAEQFLLDSTLNHGSKIALVTSSSRFSYKEFNDLSDRLATYFNTIGVKRNDRVLIFMDNCWQAAISLFAIWKVGAIASPINPSTKASKLAYILNNCEPTAILTQAKLAKITIAAKEHYTNPLAILLTNAPNDTLPEHTQSLDRALQDTSIVLSNHNGIDADLALLIYTSGSTGQPKGVMMSHINVQSAARSVSSYLEKTSNDIILNVLPLAFDYGLYQLIMSVACGATLVLEKSFAFPQAILERIREENVTGFPLVPTMAAMLLKMKSLEPGSLPSLRYISNTAAALPPSHIESLQALFPTVRIFSMYGLTECKRCTYLPPEQLKARPGSVGKAIPNSEAFVLDDDGNECAARETGELVIRGSHVMQGYWNNRAATNAVLKSGKKPWEKWLHTGDLFYKDDEGYLYFVGRKDEIIKTRGEKVAPKEVEAVLHAHPTISEAVVMGKQDPLLGQSITAMVVLKDQNIDEKQIIGYCAQNLEDFMVPQQVEIRSSLPKTDTGKISRRLALESLESAQ